MTEKTLREEIARLAADAERQSKLNPPALGDPIAVAGPWAWARMAELLRDALDRHPEPARALAAPPALAAAPGGAEIELTPAGREARDDPAEREAQGNFVSGPWCDATPPDEAHPKCTRRPGHEGDHVAARARHWEGEIRRPRLILARWPSAPALSGAPGHEPEVKE
jgi:hypothetical protein